MYTLFMFIPSKKVAETIAKKYGTPVFVTDADTIKQQTKIMLGALKGFNVKIFYAIKANYNPHIVRVIKQSGIYGIDAVSPNEVRLALDLGYTPKQIIFTPSNPSDEEIKKIGNLGIIQNLGSLSELKRFCKFFPNSKVSIRICPEVGAGESHHVTTGHNESKFGLSMSDLKEARTICAKSRVRIIGIHSHIGSGFYDAKVFQKSIVAVCKIAEKFPDLEFLDFGGGFGVSYHPEKKIIDFKKFVQAIKAPLLKLKNKNIEIRIEPGKFLVSMSTVLLARVTTLKEKDKQTFVGLDTGFNHLIRPAMYDAYHHVVNISRSTGTKKSVQVVGNICETCDIFNKKIEMIDPREGDLVAILVVGGYGSSMSSNYNMRSLAPEILIKNGKIILIKKRQNFQDIMNLFTP
jgi:diaminopimelate decarboxylase